MISPRAIDLAVQRGLISPLQADGLAAIEQALSGAGETATAGRDEEALRLVTGFSDIFVTIGIVLFTGALATLMVSLGVKTVGAVSVAAAAWLLAELFTRRRRMALPSIVLLLLFAGATFATVLELGGEGPLPPLLDQRAGGTLLVAGLAAAGAAALHYWRFRVPITVAAGMAVLLLAVLGLLFMLWPEAPSALLYLLALVWGVLTFALAMRFDLSDAARLTRRGDIAFWLHLLAAPLVVHAFVSGLLLHGQSTELSIPQAAAILVLFALLGAIAVIIDRRAILVSSLLYVGIAFASVIRSLGFSAENYLVPIVLLALGAIILLVSAGWAPLRRHLLRLVPAGLTSRLPHPSI